MRPGSIASSCAVCRWGATSPSSCGARLESGSRVSCSRTHAPRRTRPRRPRAAASSRHGCGPRATSWPSRRRRLLAADAPERAAGTGPRLDRRPDGRGDRGGRLGMAERADSTPDLPGIDVPTLVITGEGDRLIPPELSAPMADAIPGARLEMRARGRPPHQRRGARAVHRAAARPPRPAASSRRLAPHCRRRPAPTLASVTSPAAFAERYEFPLDAFQREAIDALAEGSSVLVAAPTGAGKTVVAEFALERALDAGRKCFYTTPLKALSNQKFGDFVAAYGADRVGLLTGRQHDQRRGADRRDDHRGAAQHAVRAQRHAHGPADRRDGRGPLPAGPVSRRRLGGGADPPARRPSRSCACRPRSPTPRSSATGSGPCAARRAS